MRSDPLPELINRFVSYKRDNGYQYQTGAYYLNKYAGFVMETAPETVIPDKKSVEGFLEKIQDTPGSLYNAASFLREFSRYLIARGYKSAYLIPSGRLRLPTPIQPYFFTEGEITAFFRECDRVEDAAYVKGRHLVLPAMFRLLYCCGLRCKEVRTLACRNVYLDKGYLSDYDRQISFLFPDRLTFFQTGMMLHTAPAVWNRISCVSGMPLFPRRRTPG